MTRRIRRGGNSEDFQLMFLGDVDTGGDGSAVVDGDTLIWNEDQEKFLPADPVVATGLTPDIVDSLNAAASPGTAQPFATVITQNTTLTVGPGKDFSSVQAALDSLVNVVIAPLAIVTIQIDAGTFACAAPIYLPSSFSMNVVITGATVLSKSMTSVQSSSGSAGAWSIVINLDTVTGVEVNDYVIISAPSGGTNPTYIAGCHKVTNVDAINSRITITSAHRAAVAPADAVAATVKVVKTILTFASMDGVRVWGNTTLGDLRDVVLVGSGTNYGVNLQDNGRLYTSTLIGIVGFNYNIFVNYSSQYNSDGIVASSNATHYGFIIDSGGVMDAGTGIASGCADYGVVTSGGYIRFSAGISTGNLTHGVFVYQNGFVNFQTGAVTGNGQYGSIAQGFGYMDMGSATLSDNVSGNVAMQHIFNGMNYEIRSLPDVNSGMLKLQAITQEYTGLSLYGAGNNNSSRNWVFQTNYMDFGYLSIMRSATKTGDPTTHALSVSRDSNVLLGTLTDGMTAGGSLAIAQDLAHRGAKAGFYNTAPIAKQTGVAVSAEGIHAALVALGLIGA